MCLPTLPAPERGLLQACRSGDRQAWEALLLRYGGLILAIARRCGLSREDAEDVFQTVIVRLLERLDHLSDDGRLAGWIATTAERESWRVARLARREACNGVDAAAVEPDCSAERLPQEELERLQDRRLVDEAFSHLGDRCRDLLTWLYRADPPVPYVEIAERLGVSVGSIGPTRARCLEQLRRRLDVLGYRP